MRKIAILDDYLDCARTLADWGRLAGRAEVTVFHDPIPEAAIADRLAPFDILCLMRDRTPFPRAVLDALPNLKFLTYTGGTNLALDGEAAAQRGVVMSTTGVPPSALEEHTEFVWALILATMRDIPSNDAGMRGGRWQNGYGRGLCGRTLGVIGFGNFGTRVAEMANAFKMEVLAWSQNLTVAKAAQHGATRTDSLEALLRRSDVVTIHQRLSDRTRGLIGRGQFAVMKPGAVFINTSRGPIVDEAALIEVLRGGRILRAGLDVFDIEPLPPDHPLRQLPNVVLSPHMGFVTEQVMRSFYRDSLDNIDAWLNGEPIRVVDPEIVAGRKRPPI
ncbi:MAG: D-2-hydroxyacid dehydrogenase family protein [Acidimicrobiia bacterium]|nr:D-2-hydroxyacid dehydrogenase family protein [Acidimicrobiia bacterium]